MTSLASLLTRSLSAAEPDPDYVVTTIAGQPHDYRRNSPPADSQQQQQDPSQQNLLYAGTTDYEGDEYDDDNEDGDGAYEEEPIELVPGESASLVAAATDVAEQVDRLQAWEEQLQGYSDQLTEKGWQSWKKGAVASVMHELQRKVVPDLWREEVTRAEQSVQALQERVEMASKNEKALLKRIEELEHGPGSAKELKEQLEKTELELNRQQQREKQNSVFKQLLSSGTIAANAGGGAPARPRKRATIGDMSTDSATSAAREAASMAASKGRRISVPLVMRAASAPLAQVVEEGGPSPAKSGASLDELLDGPLEEEEESSPLEPLGVAPGSTEGLPEDVEILQLRLAKAEREAEEAAAEMAEVRTQYEERNAQLEAALEEEKKKGRHAVEALESVHLEAGVHEAQEMVQLRMELTAAHEELDFLRARQAKVHEEEHRLQMVTEMSKRLGTNVSKFELESLRAQVQSLTQEAERVHKHNHQLQAEARRTISDEQSMKALQLEIAAFQKTNDHLEAEVLRRDRRTQSLEGQVKAANGRIELLQRQLVLAHAQLVQQKRIQAHHQSQAAHAQQQQPPHAILPDASASALIAVGGDAAAAEATQHATVARGGGGGGGTRRKLPLLWDGASPEPTMALSRLPLAPVSEQQQQQQQQQAAATAAGAGDSAVGMVGSALQAAPPMWPERRVTSRAHIGSPPRDSRTGVLTERAVVLHDAVEAEPITVERIVPVEPHVAKPFVADACRVISLADNRAELAAEAAWKEAQEAHDVHLTRELRKQTDASSQELILVKSTVTAHLLHARVAKLGASRHYTFLSLMRALWKWHMLLEYDHSYSAALTQAADLFETKAGQMSNRLAGAQQQVVQTLLLEPTMLGELGEMRRKLQYLYAESETLRKGLHQICERHAPPDSAASAINWLPLEAGHASLMEFAQVKLTKPPPPPPKYSVVDEADGAAATVAAPVGAAADSPADRLPTESAAAVEAVADKAVARRGGAAKTPIKMTPRRALRMAEREVDAMRLKLRLTLHHWRASRKAIERQARLIGEMAAARSDELAAAAQQAEALRRAQVQCHELLVEQETWRRQSSQQADVIAAAIASAADSKEEHAAEIAVLSEKLRQMLAERAGLQALCDSQASDLKLMSSEMIRLMGGDGILSAAMVSSQ